jgi:hypothetical protein
MPAQHVAALVSFSGRPFFERDRTTALFARIAAERKLSSIARRRAAAALGALGAHAELRKLLAGYRGELEEAEAHVRSEIERGLERR